VEPNSPESLSQGIIQMLNLPTKEREVMTKNASNRIKSHFSIDEMVSKTVLLYNQVVK